MPGMIRTREASMSAYINSALTAVLEAVQGLMRRPIDPVVLWCWGGGRNPPNAPPATWEGGWHWLKQKSSWSSGFLFLPVCSSRSCFTSPSFCVRSFSYCNYKDLSEFHKRIRLRPCFLKNLLKSYYSES